MSAAPTAPSRERRTLWTAPWWISPAQFRAACTLPETARLAPAVVLGLYIGLLPSLPADAILPVALAGLLLLFLVVALVQRYARARRRRVGMVRVTVAEFDLVCAVAQLPPHLVGEGRGLQDAFVRALWEAGGPDARASALEQRMRALVASAAPTPAA